MVPVRPLSPTEGGGDRVPVVFVIAVTEANAYMVAVPRGNDRNVLVLPRRWYVEPRADGKSHISFYFDRRDHTILYMIWIARYTWLHRNDDVQNIP